MTATTHADRRTRPAGPSSAPGRSPAGLRVLFLDPIGHLFGNLDHAICEGLAAQGCDVILGTNERAPPSRRGARYRRVVPWCGVVGDTPKFVKAVNYVRSRRRVLATARRLAPDLVVLYYVLEPRLDATLVRRLQAEGFPVVVCAHDVLPLDQERPNLPAWRRLYALADRVAVFGAFARRQLGELFAVPRGKIVSTFLGVDREETCAPAERLAARARLGIGADEQALLCFGQIKRNKGLDVLLPAFARVAGRHPRARLWVVGRPWHVDPEPQLKLAARLGLGERVAFRLGWVTRDDVADWFHAADLGVLSYTHLYQSAVAGRACAHGLPLVASAVGDIPELLRDERGGWLVPPRDEQALAGALDEALGDPAGAAARGAAARERVRAEFSWAAFAADFAAQLAAVTPARSGLGAGGGAAGRAQPLRVAILGTRGIPANYGGYETFAEELAARLVRRGHAVTVYGRSHSVPAGLSAHRGVALVTLPALRSKYLDTVLHGALSALHVMFRRVDVVLMCNAVNSPACLLPRLAGRRVLMNVDGLDWTRRKWNALGRLVALAGARLALWCPHHLITDAVVVQDFYRDRFGAESVFIPYGSRTLDAPAADPAILARHGLVAGRYLLYVSRLEPENNAHVVIEAFAGVPTEMALAIVGWAPYAQAYIAGLKAAADRRVVFLGGVYGDDYLALQQNCYLYVQATEVGGTHPALLEGLGAGKCVVYNDVPEHREVLGEHGFGYRGVDGLRERLAQLVADPATVAEHGRRARDLVRQRYDWEDVTDRYESLFHDVVDGGFRFRRRRALRAAGAAAGGLDG